MKKQRARGKTQGNRRKGPGTGPTASMPQRKPRSRRQLLLEIRNWGIGVAVLGGVGVLSARSVIASIAEHDLERIGTGTPSVVQIHDPNCGLCQQLQSEVREALSAIDDDRLTYLVANIRTDEGRALANRYQVPHVTLLLFDADGQLVSTLRGVQDSSVLKGAFRNHLARHTSS
ncbi:MAG: thioredoxin family protein [Pseudomonadota bacterium]